MESQPVLGGEDPALWGALIAWWGVARSLAWWPADRGAQGAGVHRGPPEGRAATAGHKGPGRTAGCLWGQGGSSQDELLLIWLCPFTMPLGTTGQLGAVPFQSVAGVGFVLVSAVYSSFLGPILVNSLSCFCAEVCLRFCGPCRSLCVCMYLIHPEGASPAVPCSTFFF